MLCGPWPLTARSPAAKVLMGGRDAVLGTHKLEKSDHRRSQGQTGFWNPTGGLVFRSFLALSLVRGTWGHAGDAWFVDLGR
jgi:hypothetical protein